jgi:hypothetical protein
MPTSLLRALWSSALLLVVLLASACSLFDSDSATTTPAAEPSPAAETPTTQPSPPSGTPAPGDTVGITWVDEPLVTRPASGQELERPFAEFLIEGEDLWRVYLVEGDGAPALVTQSRRLLSTPLWAAAGESLLIPYATRLDSLPGFAFVNGYLSYTPGRADAVWEEVFEPAVSARPSPDQELLLITDRRNQRGAIYLKEPSGRSWRLEGLGSEVQSDGWSPDGRFFLVSFRKRDHELGLPARTYYAIEPHASRAVLVGLQDYSISPRWSPDSRRLAFLEGHDLVLFDLASRRREAIPIGLYLPAAPRWNATGSVIAVGNGAVDAVANRVLIQPDETNVTDSAVSADGRRFAVGLEPFQRQEATCPIPPLANETRLHDLSTGDSAPLLTCEDGFYAYLDWLPNGKLLVAGPNCWACEGNSRRYGFVTLTDGAVQPLTDGLEAAASHDVSPDGGRVLIGGAKLRVYSSDGVLERVIDVPRGFAVRAVAWSPDGSSFVYVVGPARMNLI